MEIKFIKFDKDKDCILPSYATDGSAGMDLCSALKGKVVLKAGGTILIGTNLIIEIPAGYEGQVRPRSGLALKHGITVLNSPGTIDSDYRGEVKVLLINHGGKDFEINFGDRIAQLIISKHEKAKLIFSESLSETRRGTGGYGSTGK